jgi:DnaK suppressor protein
MDPKRARQLLEDERAAVQRLRDEADAQRQLQDHETDQTSADAGSEMLERELRESLAVMLDADLREVDAALERLDEGTYGRCEQCAAAIPVERLAALPATRYCVTHASGRETPPRSGRPGAHRTKVE